MKIFSRNSGPLLAVTAALMLSVVAGGNARAAAPTPPGWMTLEGHVPPVVLQAAPVRDASPTAAHDSAPITLTIVLRRTDPLGFQSYLADVYDAKSVNFRKFLTPAQVTERFGPSARDYATVLTYFNDQGFALGQGSANRMTLTLNGTRADAERSLAVTIKDYRLGDRAVTSGFSDGRSRAFCRSLPCPHLLGKTAGPVDHEDPLRHGDGDRLSSRGRAPDRGRTQRWVTIPRLQLAVLPTWAEEIGGAH
ncbi:MAG: protease pro-enzyme activation domain-containing protein [Casimicrobiaceae bacterium]